ncbi:MAG TPA: phosphatase PAP2 family protein [Longimicrobiales bacterium]
MDDAQTPREPPAHRRAHGSNGALRAAAERRLRRRRLRHVGNTLYGTLRFVAEHVQGVYSAYAAFLSIAFVGAAALAAFVGVAKVVLEGFAQPWDDSFLRWIAAYRTPFLTRIALQVTQLGTGIVLAMIVLIGSSFLWLTRHRHSSYLLLASYFGAWLLNNVLKDVFERPRPLVVSPLAATATWSFPSGHAMTSIAAYGCIALLVTRLEDNGATRAFTWFLAVVVVLLIGASRLYLGVHYPSDVIGGFAAGLAWVAFAAAGMTALQFFARRAPAIHEDERHLERPRR